MSLLEQGGAYFANPLIGGAVLDTFKNANAPNYTLPGVGPETNALMEQHYKNLNLTPDEIVQREMQGTDSAKQMLQTPQQIQHRNTALGMSQPDSMTQAITDRAQRAFQSDYNKMQKQAQMNAPIQEQRNLSQAQQAIMMNQDMIYNGYVRQITQQQNEKAARNQAIGSILGGAGMVAGAMFGGPAGASAGGSIGSGLAGNQQMSSMGG